MIQGAPLYTPPASPFAREVDLLFFGTVGLAVLFTVIVALMAIGFAVKYRRRHEHEIGVEIHGNLMLEIAWSVIPLLLAMGVFAWGARLFVKAYNPPADAMSFWVVGKQWMWKVQAPSGRREINELHVPVNRAIKLTLTSEDVIHSFYVPAMRMKVDAVPGRYNTMWFRADTVGTYHLFCAEFCGVEHSRMIGKVVVLSESDYEAWLSGQNPGGPKAVMASGEELFAAKACNTCHREDSTARAPMLWGLSGTTVALLGGGTATADEEYLRESILNPMAKVVNGYQPIMPTFKGQLTEDEVIQLVKYIKDLKASAATASAELTNAQPEKAVPPAQGAR